MGADEQILVVPRAQLLPPEGLNGFLPGDTARYLERVRRFGEFRRRGDVEEDASLKQVIPYLIIRHLDRVFLFQRTHGGGERRLRGRFSIGVGGHIVREDADGANDLLRAGLERELQEELVIAPVWRTRSVGVLNEEDTPVSRVHFGLVYMVETEDPRVRVREADRLTGSLATAADLAAVRDRMESWSQRILDAADPFAL